jgi:hypothetical protein
LEGVREAPSVQGLPARKILLANGDMVILTTRR